MAGVQFGGCAVLLPHLARLQLDRVFLKGAGAEPVRIDLVGIARAPDTPRAKQALAAVKLHLVREVDGRNPPGADGATGVAMWLRGRLRISIHAAKRLVEVARQLTRSRRLRRPRPSR